MRKHEYMKHLNEIRRNSDGAAISQMNKEDENVEILMPEQFHNMPITIQEEYLLP